VLAYNDKLFLAEHQNGEGLGGSDAQPSRTIRFVYIVCGHLKVTCQGKSFVLRAGGTLSLSAAAFNTAPLQSRIRS